MLLIKTILVPTDFSAPGEHALAYACELADLSGASLHLLHVIEDPFSTAVYPAIVVAPPEGYFEQLDQQSRAHLMSLLTEDEQRKYRAVFATRMGHAATEILNYTLEHGVIDLIVMATTGRNGVARLLMGSVTDKIMRTAPCPVLTVHARDRAEPTGASRAA